MTNPGELIISTIEALAKLLPIRIIHEYEQGLRWTLGRPGTILSKGLHFFLWGIQSIDRLDTTINAIDLEPQTLRTSDKLEFTLKAAIQFKITDIKKFYLGMQDGEAAAGFPTLASRARGLLATALSVKTYDEIWEDKESLEVEIADEIGAWAKVYGIRLENLDITECGKSQSFRIFIDRNQTIFEGE